MCETSWRWFIWIHEFENNSFVASKCESMNNFENNSFVAEKCEWEMYALKMCEYLCEKCVKPRNISAQKCEWEMYALKICMNNSEHLCEKCVNHEMLKCVNISAQIKLEKCVKLKEDGYE